MFYYFSYSINYSKLFFLRPHFPISPTHSPNSPVADFLVEILGSTKFFFGRLRRKPGVHAPRVAVSSPTSRKGKKVNYEEAFGFAGYEAKHPSDEERLYAHGNGNGTYSSNSGEENIGLEAYSHA